MRAVSSVKTRRAGEQTGTEERLSRLRMSEDKKMRVGDRRDSFPPNS